MIDRAPITTDTDLAASGVQTDVVIRTTLAAGAAVTLEVRDIGGNVTGTFAGVVDAEHDAVIAAVSVPAPRAILVARTDDTCGVAEDLVGVDVLVGGDCAMTVTPAPQPSAFFAPLGVLNIATDTDLAMPGHQATVSVETVRSAMVEVFASGPQGEVSLGSVLATSGTGTLAVTVPEGQITLRATCARPGTTFTSAALTAVVDTVAPTCDVVAPADTITITPDLDLDGDLANGIQLTATGHVAGADVFGEPVTFTITETGGSGVAIAGTSVDALGTTIAAVTLDPAATPTSFAFAIAGRDHAGNTCGGGSQYPVAYTFVSFAAPAADGKVSSNDGTVAGNALTFPLCGAVTRDGASVSITIDGGSPIVATVTGRTWCADVTVTEAVSPPHAIVATATVGTDSGAGTLQLAVDVTPPTQVGAFGATVVDRQRIELAWTAPSDGGGAAPSYLAKLATVPLTDANFDTTGTVVATAAPAAPGTPESLAIFPARTGTTVFFGIAAIDSFGNRARAVFSGPLQPLFDQTGAITPPDPLEGLLGFGSAIAHGRFNDDDFPDVAIGAPTRNDGALLVGAVYVYFGGPSGIGSSPGLVIKGQTGQGRFGAGLAALRRSSATREDLVVGAPGGDGKLFVFDGGATLGTGTRLASTASAVVRVDTANPGAFAAAALGARVVTADVDGDDVQDLIASTPGLAGGTGGAVILYGGTIGNDVALSDVDATGSGSTIVELIRDPGAGANTGLGFYLWAVGETEGPTDTTDDLVLVYADDQTTGGDTLYVFRSDGTRPIAPGVTTRAFVPSRDARVDFVTTTKATDWGAAVAAIEDQDGDGASDLVVSAYRQNRALIISGDLTGIVSTGDPGVVRTTFLGGTGVTRLGAAIVANDGRSSGDVDGDGRQDLLIGGTQNGVAHLFIWFGGAIPTGTVTASSAGFANPLDPANVWRAPGKGQAGVAEWIGDVDGDGLDDICVASPLDNASDGLFEVLFD